MDHFSSRMLFAHWCAQRAGHAVPDREAIDPGEIRTALADTLIVGLDSAGGHPLRLAGTRVCALFGRELKGSSFLDLWRPHDRETVDGWIDAASDEETGVLAGITGSGEIEQVRLELLLLPLRQNRAITRLIGVLAPLTVPFWFGSRSISTLSVMSFRYLPGETLGGDRMRRKPVQARRGLLVYEGGR